MRAAHDLEVVGRDSLCLGDKVGRVGDASANRSPVTNGIGQFAVEAVDHRGTWFRRDLFLLCGRLKITFCHVCESKCKK